MESGDAFTSVALVPLPAGTHILRSSWCPDKDLLVTIHRVGSKDKLSLWKMQGAKKWEVELDTDGSGKEEVVDIAWSPDGQSIAVAINPPRVCLLSIQDGHQQRFLPIPQPTARSVNLRGIWWFREQREEDRHRVPEIFKRGGNVTGSAHSILKGQPLLDPLQDDSQRLTTADLFAFRGAQARAAGEPSLPSVISSWPSLPTDSSAASIKPTTVGGTYCDETLDEDDNLNLDSVLAVSLDSGHLHCFVDGSFPLGAIALPDNHSVVSLVKTQDLLCAHLAPSDSLQPSSVALHPCIIQVPHLTQRALRDVARVSSSARELTWYTMRVVKEMRATWFGSESQGGVRELGPKWMRALEKRQKEDFGVHEPNAMLDLTSLLATGRASESLSDFFGSGDQMSERGLQKWESSVVDALTKLRNYAEKRVAPACQRLHLLLEEVQGWSQLPQYKACDFRTGDIDDSLQLVSRAIVIANWLAAATRREMIRFKEFMAWLRYETSRLNTDPHNPPPLRHDILEVNDYMMSGLVASPIDKWFMGPVPQLLPKDLGVATEPLELSTMMQKARHALKEPNQLSGQSPAKHKDLSHLDRNLDSLIQDFASRCQRIFAEASHATARSAIITPRSIPARIGGSTVRDVAAGSEPLVRERTTVDRETDSLAQLLIMKISHSGNDYLCIARLQHSLQGGPSVQLSVAAMQCCIPRENEAGDRVPMHILDAEFFDESTLIVVYRFESEKGSAFLATVGYSELSFQLIESRDYVNELAREDLMVDLLEHLRKGQLSYAPIPVIRSRKLRGCTEGKVNLAVNGRIGRRVACVLDNAGVTLEVVDIEVGSRHRQKFSQDARKMRENPTQAWSGSESPLGVGARGSGSTRGSAITARATGEGRDRRCRVTRMEFLTWRPNYSARDCDFCTREFGPEREKNVV